MKKYDVVLIGGGPAAISAVRVFGASPQKLSVLLIRPETYSMIYCAMPYAIEGIIPVEKTYKKDSLVTDNGADLVRDKVVSVDFDKQTVTTEKGEVFGYQKLMVTTGANPIVPDIPGAHLGNVLTFKTGDDLDRIVGIVEGNLRNAVIVGAGAIGVELAQALNSKGADVHLVDMQGHLLPNLVDAEMAEVPQDKLVAAGINLHLNARVTALKGNGNAREVVLDNGQTISLDENGEGSGLVVFAVGMRAEVGMFDGTDLALGGNGIIVNSGMETNIPSVYAAGDCAEFSSAITGKPMEGKLATNAVPMGKVAAKRILGKQAVYGGFYNGAATKVYDVFVGGTGLTEGAAVENGYTPVTGYGETTTRFPIMPDAGKVKVKLVVDSTTRRVIGGQVVGNVAVAERVDLITFAIQKGATVDELASFSYSAQPYQTFFPAGNAIVMAAEKVIGKL